MGEKPIIKEYTDYVHEVMPVYVEIGELGKSTLRVVILKPHNATHYGQLNEVFSWVVMIF